MKAMSLRRRSLLIRLFEHWGYRRHTGSHHGNSTWAIDLFVGQVDLRAVGDDQRELHFLGTRALVLQEYALNPRKD